jgi:hypothetical protein
MYRYALAAAMLAALSSWPPAYAATARDKMVTCKFGADDQHLQGKARSAFMKKCMSDKTSRAALRRRPARQLGTSIEQHN